MQKKKIMNRVCPKKNWTIKVQKKKKNSANFAKKKERRKSENKTNRECPKKKIRSRKSAPRPPRWLMVDPLSLMSPFQIQLDIK